MRESTNVSYFHDEPYHWTVDPKETDEVIRAASSFATICFVTSGTVDTELSGADLESLAAGVRLVGVEAYDAESFVVGKAK